MFSKVTKKTIMPAIWDLMDRVTQYIQLQSLHPIAHSYSFTQTFHSSTDIATPSPPLIHVRIHIHTQVRIIYPFMLNLLVAYPIYLINTNVHVGPITHPYYTKYEIWRFFVYFVVVVISYHISLHHTFLANWHSA